MPIPTVAVRSTRPDKTATTLADGQRISTLSQASNSHREARQTLARLLRNTPLPDDELIHNLGLYLPRQALSRILYMADLYRQIVDVHGVVMELGVRWGQNMALFSALRGIYEPYNYNRKIIGFDTFSGFPGVDAKDGSQAATGDYSVSANYDRALNEVLAAHEALSPLDHITKYELVKGDASETIRLYLEQNPHTIVAMAYFDFDLYSPTKACLEAILPRIPKGGILAFDELNHASFPGETAAVFETIDIKQYQLHRTPLNPTCSYFRIE
jgi:hypothetical protein